MGTITARRTQTAPLSLAVSNESGPVTGLTATVAVRRGETSNSYLDFADLAFKTAGWTTKNQALAEVGGGVYALTSALNLATITNLAGSTRILFAEFTVSGSVDAVAVDTIQIDDDGPSLDELLAIGKNRLEVNITTGHLELYDDAGTTVIQRWALDTNGGEPVTTQAGVQTKRGAPLL